MPNLQSKCSYCDLPNPLVKISANYVLEHNSEIYYGIAIHPEHKHIYSTSVFLVRS